MTWDKIFSSLDIMLHMDLLLISVLLIFGTIVNYVLSECHRIADWVKMDLWSKRSGCKLKYRGFPLNIRNHIFTVGVSARK